MREFPIDYGSAGGKSYAPKRVYTTKVNGVAVRLRLTGKYPTNGGHIQTGFHATFKWDGKQADFTNTIGIPDIMGDPHGLKAIYSILAWLTLRDGDTDPEFFDDYTPAQLAWRDSRECEYLASWVSDREEAIWK